MDERDTRQPTLWSRRDLVTRSGWALMLGSFGAASIATVRLLFPRVTFDPPATVVLGKPSDFAVGEVSDKWKKSHRIILVREEAGFYALRSVCTHLGCVPNWQPDQGIFKCPCHGSSFLRSGINLEGPAPRPLERLGISLDEGGRIVVDASIRLREERGEWEKEVAYLNYTAEGRDEPT